MSEDPTTALIAIEERLIVFHDDEITIVLVEDPDGTRQWYVAVRPICKYLGLSWSGQFERIDRDPVLQEVARKIRVRRTAQGGNPEMFCLPLDYLNGWLFGVSANRVKEALREKLIRYQRDCYRVLARAFQSEELVTDQESSSVTALMNIREMGLAIARMAEEQLAMEQRLTTRLDRAAQVVSTMDRRLRVVEQRLSPPEYVSDEQATEIMLAVKALAERLNQRDTSKDHYQAVYAEIYRRFHAPSYRQLSVTRYHDVIQFLAEWSASVSKE